MVKYSEEEYREALEKWLSEHPGLTINDIGGRVTVILDSGKKITLGIRINKIKQILKGNVKSRFDDSQKKYWVEEKGLSLENKNYYPSEEEYREALEKWLREHPGKNINDVASRVTVILDSGKKITLGKRIITIKDILKGTINGELNNDQIRYWVEEKGLVLDNKSDKVREVNEQEYRKALEIWLREHPGENINDITQKEVITLQNGKKVTLGTRIKYIRAILKGTVSGFLSDDQIDYWVIKHELKLYKNEDKTSNYLDNIIDVDKKLRVKKCLDDLKVRRRKKTSYNIDNILSEFDIDIERLSNILDGTRRKEDKPRSPVLEYKGRSLRSFCIKNGYNYEVISRAVRLHEILDNDNLEELINRVLINYEKSGQKEPATWIYEKYGNLVKHILLYLGLDSKSIIKDMTNYVVTLEEAIRHEVFKRGNESKENAWLEELYNYLIEEVTLDKEKEQTEEDLATMFMILVEEYHLTKEEYSLLWNVFSKYVKVMREYEIVDVGLETNNDKRLEKINKYNLDEYDIEESFFIPLKFDKGVLLGRQSELYKRRELLRSYIIDWDYYSEEEKELIKYQNNFTLEEINYINKTRSNINETVNKINN